MCAFYLGELEYRWNVRLYPLMLDRLLYSFTR